MRNATRSLWFWLGLVLIAVVAAIPAQGQNLRQLARSTAITGTNDSALTLVSDSANRTRAASISELRKALAVAAFDSLRNLTALLTADSSTRAATTAYVRRVTATLGTTFPLLATNGSAVAPVYSYTNSTGLGLYRFGVDTLGLATGGKRAGIVGLDSSLTMYGTVKALLPSGGATPAIQLGTNATGFGQRGDTISIFQNGGYRWRFHPGASTLEALGAATLQGGTGDMSIIAGTGNSRRLLARTTTSAGVVTTAMRWNETQQSLFTDGSQARPGLALASDSTIGLMGGVSGLGLVQGGTLRWLVNSSGNFASQTNNAVDIGGTANAPKVIHSNRYKNIADGGSDNPAYTFAADTTIGMYRNGSGLGLAAGGAARMTLGSGGVRGIVVFQAPDGTAASPGYQMFSSSGTGWYRAVNDTLGLSSGGSAFAKGLRDTLIINSKAKAPSLTAASGTPNTVCIDATTKQLTENAATSCVVSSARFKKNIRPLAFDSAAVIVRRLTAVTYEMKDGGRRSIHVIAEQADSISARLSFRDGQGRVHSVDDGAILSALLRVVQQQQKSLDSLTKVVAGIRK